MSLPQDIQLKFEQAFLDCHCMSDETQRKRVLEYLSPDIRLRIIEREGDTTLTRVSHIVAKCSDYEEGIEQLAYGIHEIDGETMAWSQLDKLVQKKFPKVVTYRERKQLLSVMDDIEWSKDVLKKAYQDSLPKLRSPTPFNGNTDLLMQILKDLGALPSQDDHIFPVLEFVERLAIYAQELQFPIWLRLKEWMNEKAWKLGLNDTDVNNIRAKASHRPVVRIAPYLLIMLEPTSDEKLYCVQAWLLDDHYHSIQAGIAIDDAPVPLQYIPDLIDDVIQHCLGMESLVDMIDNLVIEFSVPRTLFCSDVDHWLVDTGFSKAKLGVQYRVVIRSSERASRVRMWPAWRAKWRIFQELIERRCTPHDNDYIRISTPEECQSHDRLQAQLRGSSVVCFALTHVPPEMKPQKSHLFDPLLATGIPIALWPRKQLNDSSSLEALLSFDTLKILRDSVWEQRRKAEGDECHIGSHLTLLWDDPFRLPPSMTAQPLASPRKG